MTNLTITKNNKKNIITILIWRGGGPPQNNRNNLLDVGYIFQCFHACVLKSLSFFKHKGWFSKSYYLYL